MTPYIDIHTHFRTNVPDVISVLNLSQVEDWGEISLVSSDASQQSFSIGLHPWFLTPNNAQEDFNNLKNSIENQQITALGECGLDRLKGESLEFQIPLFEQQIRLAEAYKKPVIIHCVKAYSEVISIKKNLKPRIPLIIHGFNQNEQILKELLKNQFYISIGTNVLMPNSNAFKALKQIPLSQLFLETDDKKEDIRRIYERVAEILNMPLEELKKAILENFSRILTGY